MDEEEIETIARSALKRALEEFSSSHPKSILTLGEEKTYAGTEIVMLVMMAPCKCKPRSRPIFMSSNKTMALRDATDFVKGLIEGSEHADEID